MTDSIDLTKYNIMTDSMYDTTGTQMVEPKKPMIYTTPFEQQPKYLMRAGNKPFQPSKYPSAGYEWYTKRAVNDVDLQTDMEKVLPNQQVQNWGRTKTIILQKEDAKPTKEGMEGISEKIKRIKERAARKKKEGYITSPFAEAEDTWSSAGRIKSFQESFSFNGKEFEVIDVIIVILVIVILVVGIYIYIAKQKEKKTIPTQSTSSKLEQNESPLPLSNEEDYYEYLRKSSDLNPNPEPKPTKEFKPLQRKTFNTIRQSVLDGNKPPMDVTKELVDKHREGYRGGDDEPKTLNCGSLSGGAAFDTKF